MVIRTKASSVETGLEEKQRETRLVYTVSISKLVAGAASRDRGAK